LAKKKLPFDQRKKAKPKKPKSRFRFIKYLFLIGLLLFFVAGGAAAAVLGEPGEEPGDRRAAHQLLRRVRARRGCGRGAGSLVLLLVCCCSCEGLFVVCGAWLHACTHAMAATAWGVPLLCSTALSLSAPDF